MALMGGQGRDFDKAKYYSHRHSAVMESKKKGCLHKGPLVFRIVRKTIGVHIITYVIPKKGPSLPRRRRDKHTETRLS